MKNFNKPQKIIFAFLVSLFFIACSSGSDSSSGDSNNDNSRTGGNTQVRDIPVSVGNYSFTIKNVQTSVKSGTSATYPIIYEGTSDITLRVELHATSSSDVANHTDVTFDSVLRLTGTRTTTNDARDSNISALINFPSNTGDALSLAYLADKLFENHKSVLTTFTFLYQRQSSNFIPASSHISSPPIHLTTIEADKPEDVTFDTASKETSFYEGDRKTIWVHSNHSFENHKIFLSLKGGSRYAGADDVTLEHSFLDFEHSNKRDYFTLTVATDDTLEEHKNRKLGVILNLQGKKTELDLGTIYDERQGNIIFTNISTGAKTNEINLNSLGATADIIISGAKGMGKYTYTETNKGVVALDSVSSDTLETSRFKITASSDGATTITFTKTGDNYYHSSNPASLTVSVRTGIFSIARTIRLTKKTISFTYGDSSNTEITATSSGDGLWRAISQNPNIATADINQTTGRITITPKNAGKTTINIIRNASGNYNEAKSSITVEVNPKARNISINPQGALTLTYGAVAKEVIANSNGTGDWRLTTPHTNIITAQINRTSGKLTITPKAVGDATITITRAKAGNYLEATLDIAVNVSTSSRSIGLTKKTISFTYGDSSKSEITATSSGDGLWRAISQNPNIATADINQTSGLITITPKNAGKTTINIIRNASGNYNEANTSITVEVNPKARNIIINLSGTLNLTYGETKEVTADTNDGTGDWNFTNTYTTTITAQINQEGKITFTPEAVGDATITITRAKAGNYQEVTLDIGVKVHPATRTIAPLSNGNVVALTFPNTHSDTAETTGDGIWQISSNLQNIATTDIDQSGNFTIIPKAVGDATITITRLASSNYKQAKTTIKVFISKGNQSPISISQSNFFIGIGASAVTATLSGGSSTGDFVVSSKTNNIATITVSGNTLTIDPDSTSGTITADISRKGGNNYYDSNIITISIRIILGSGSPADPYQVELASDLQSIGQDSTSLSAYYEQTATIDLKGIANFRPIGDYNNSFRGSFNGNNFKIIGLTIDRSSDIYIGLFGYISNATLKNIHLEEVRVQGRDYVGGLLGWNEGGTITSSSASGDVQGNSVVGGLVGFNGYNSNIRDSYSSGSVLGNLNVGGLVGSNNNSIIQDNYSSSSVLGNQYVGGLVGFNLGRIERDNYTNTIQNSYASGSVRGNSSVGGLVGRNNDSVIQDSYSSSSVIGNQYVGGLVGYNDGSAIQDSYSSGAVIGNQDVGGLTGSNLNGTIQTSYWNSETSGQTKSEGGTSRTSLQMLSGNNSDHFSGFSDSSWGFGDASSYPTLTNNIANNTNQHLHQVAGMIRLANAMGDKFLADNNLQQDMTLDTSTISSDGDVLFVFDTNAAAPNNSNREDFWDCENNRSSDILLETQSVNGTNIELRFASGTTDKTAWQKQTTPIGSCAIVRRGTRQVQAGEKIHLEAIISKGKDTDKRSYTKKFSLTFE